jgi:glucose/arabinose dehydrogenase
MFKWISKAALAAAFFSAVPALELAAATLPPGFMETVIGDTAASTGLAVLPDGRVLVCEKAGALRVIKNDALLPAPMMVLPVDASGERGLLGLAVDPTFADHPYIFVYYTTPSPVPHNRISRFTVTGDTASPASEVVLMDLEPLGNVFHNGGGLHFGPDGMLYASVGENTIADNSQTLSNRLGKILRIVPDGSIPTDNPFYLTATGPNRSIYALGLRNPFSFAFGNLTGQFFINDVGQDSWEEVDEGMPGANYGWPATEGDFNPAEHLGLTPPIHTYANAGEDCAVIGAAFYEPLTPRFPLEYFGHYFFSDYCGGWIHSMDPSTHAVSGFATGTGQVTDLVLDYTNGSLIYGRVDGLIRRISFADIATPSLTATETVTETPVPATSTATVTETATEAEASATSTPTVTATATEAESSATPTLTATATATATEAESSATPTATATSTPTVTETATEAEGSATSTPTVTETATEAEGSATSTPTVTETATEAEGSATSTPTVTETATEAESSATSTPTVTETATEAESSATSTPTVTETATVTPTPTASPTSYSASGTPTTSVTVSASATASSSPASSSTATRTVTRSATATSSPSPAGSPSPTATATGTPPPGSSPTSTRTPGVKPGSPTPEPTAVAAPRVTDAYVTPLPLRNGAATVHFKLNDQADTVRVTVYSLRHSIGIYQASGRFHPGWNRVDFDWSALLPGPYFARVAATANGKEGPPHVAVFYVLR